MRLAVISDIHGNLEALQAVLSDIDTCRVDAIICLGDNIGYGAEPERVLQEIRARNIPSILGNHELAVNDSGYLGWFNSLARKSLLMTRDMLSQASIDYIARLKPWRSSGNCLFVHGFPPDSCLTYTFQVSDAEKKMVFEQMQQPICFIGHTHTLELLVYSEQEAVSHRLPRGITRLETKNKYIINIGSVGQPRDGSCEAKYVIWDAPSSTIELRCVSYDIAAAAEKIIAAGLPREHADRLW